MTEGTGSHEGLLHTERGRALSFGGVAALYDRARPAYPPALIDALMAFRPRNVLDVGCGTGKASRLFIERGCEVLGIEPDPLMARVARSHGVNVEEGAFEDWPAQGRRFDMVVSGQAWHWVDPTLGPAKAASVLPPGGHLAPFWNTGVHDPEVAEALREVYRRLAPSIIATTETAVSPGQMSEQSTGTERRSERRRALEASPDFSSVEVSRYPWDATYDRVSWLDYIATHSDHVLLPEEQRRALLDAVGAVIDSFGGTITYHFSTLLLLATRAM
jgi:SAM-dependent methyltransferase